MRFAGFPRAGVVGVSSSDRLVLQPRGSRELLLVSGAGAVLGRLPNTRAWKLSPGGRYLLVGSDRLVRCRDGETRRAPRAAARLRARAEAFELVVRPEVVLRSSPGRETVAHLRGNFVAAVLRSDGVYLATIGPEGLVVFDWAARARALVVRQTMIGTVAMGLDGTVAFARPLEGEVTVMEQALPPAAPGLDDEAQRLFDRGAPMPVMLQGTGPTPAEERKRVRLLARLETTANAGLLELVRASTDRRIAPVLDALRDADSIADLEPVLDELAEIVGYEGELFAPRAPASRWPPRRSR